HDLHQALRACRRTSVHDEARLLSDKSVDPGRIEPASGRHRLELVVEGRDEAQAEIVLLAGTIGGIDAAVEHALAAGPLCGSQQLPVVHAAQLEVPFAIALESQADLVELQGAGK